MANSSKTKEYFKKIKERLSLSEERYRLLTENVTDIIWTMDMNLKFTYFNPFVEKMLGYNTREALALKIDELLTPASYELAINTLKEELAEEEKKDKDLLRSRTLELEHRRKDGSVVWGEVKMTFIRDKKRKAVGILGISRDITERKRMEERLKDAYSELEIRVKVRTAELSKAIEDFRKEINERRRVEEMLRESEARYRAVVEDQTELICRFLPDAIITFVNDAYCRYFGKSRQELIGKSFMQLIPENDRKIVQENLNKLSKENPVMMHEHRVIAADGSVRWQQWINRMIFDTQGNFIEYQAVGRDITEFKKPAQKQS